jgi:microcystin-dependent protein
MPRNSSGTYSLPIAAFVSGTTIRSADMNSNLSDIGTALTQSVATTGVSSMSGPLKLSDGTAIAPSLTLASDLTTGWYKSASGTWTYVGTGTSVITLAPTGATITNLTVTNLTVTGSFTVASARVIGEVVDFCGAAAPALFLFAFGQAISRTTYSQLFSVIGTAFGAGDGLTTFNVPDYRGRTSFGKDDMGGSAANRITVAGGNFDGTVLGGIGGSQNKVLVQSNLPNISLTAGSAGTHNHTWERATDDASSAGTGSGFGFLTGTGVFVTTSSDGAHTHSVPTGGTDTPVALMNPCLIINKMIYAGV